MIIVDPVKLGDVACTRASPKWVWDRTGTLVEVPANTLGVTYDPTDLSKAPYALIEAAATNRLKMNTRLDHTEWPKLRVIVDGDTAVSPDGTPFADKVIPDAAFATHYIEQQVNQTFSDGEVYTFSVYVKAAGMAQVRMDMYYAIGSTGGHAAMFDLAAGTCSALSADIKAVKIEALPGGWYRCILTSTVTFSATHPNRVLCRLVFFDLNNSITFSGNGVDGLWMWGPQFEDGDRATSLIKTLDVPVTRAADVIGPGAGLIYSNVPMVEPPYSATTSYAKDALVLDPSTHELYLSLIDANKGKPLTDEASWNPRGKTNRWAMFDDYNNTQTTNAEEIVVVLSPQSICEGLYLGNVDADEIELVVVDQAEGIVYSEVISLVTASGSSSYYDWCFRPADRADYCFTVAMPPYAAALVTVVLRKPGGVAKCGMAAIGLVDDFGPSLYGLSASGKDFSSTTFNFDGTSKTQFRDYAKQMNVDVQVNNGEIDYIQRRLFQLRQRPIVWIGGPYGATAVFGRYVSFDIVIPGLLKSDMSLQIEGSV